MRKFRTLALIGVVLGMSLTHTAAHAQGMAETDLRVIHWQGMSTGRTNGSQFGSWTSNMMGLELNRLKASGWGFGFQYLWSSQGRGTGSWASLENGSDSIFQAWVSRRITPPDSRVDINLWGGYGKYRWDSTFLGGSRELFRSKGLMVGASFYAPIARNLDVGARLSYFPSNGTTLERGGVTTTASGSAWDYSVNLSYDVSSNVSLLVGYRAQEARAGNLAGCPNCVFKVDGWYGNIVFKR